MEVGADVKQLRSLARGMRVQSEPTDAIAIDAKMLPFIAGGIALAVGLFLRRKRRGSGKR